MFEYCLTVLFINSKSNNTTSVKVVFLLIYKQKGVRVAKWYQAGILSQQPGLTPVRVKYKKKL